MKKRLSAAVVSIGILSANAFAGDTPVVGFVEELISYIFGG